MTNWQRGVLRMMRVANHPVTVAGIADLTPWYRRIRFTAPDLVCSLELFPTLWLRLWAPNPARGEGEVSQRAYTLVDVRPAEGTFCLDFVLYDVEGPAGEWAKRARVGDRVEVALTPRRVMLPDDAGPLLLAGDATAFPAITSWLDALPAGVPVTVLVEDGHPDHDALPRPDRPGTDWHWVSPAAVPGAALASAIEATTPPAPGLFAWAAGEKTLVQHVRTTVRDTLGLDRAHHFTQFYWITGKATG